MPSPALHSLTHMNTRTVNTCSIDYISKHVMSRTLQKSPLGVTVRDGDGVTGEGRLVLKPNFHVNKWSVVIKYIQLGVYLLTTSDD